MGTQVQGANLENAVVAGAYWFARQLWRVQLGYRERREAVHSGLAIGLAMLIVVAAPSVESATQGAPVEPFSAESAAPFKAESAAAKDVAAASVESGELVSAPLSVANRCLQATEMQ